LLGINAPFSRGYKDFLSDIANALLCLTIGVRCETTITSKKIKCIGLTQTGLVILPRVSSCNTDLIV